MMRGFDVRTTARALEQDAGGRAMRRREEKRRHLAAARDAIAGGVSP